jgi:hypothetical protein
MICNTSCLTAVALPTPYLCEDIIDGGGEKLLFLKCDSAFTDILNPAEWAAKIAAGEIALTPSGAWEKPLAEQNSTTLELGCRDVKYSKKSGHLINYESFLLSKDLEHFAFAENLEQNYRAYRVIPIDCDGTFYLNKPYADLVESGAVAPLTIPDMSIGYEFSWEQTPDFEIPKTNKDVQKLMMSLHISTNTVLKGVKLPGVLAALGLA